MEVVGLWRYPVKSLQGEPLDAASVEADGVVGDRRWGLRDQRTGRILTARRRPELLGASASYDDDEPVITLPDGGTVVGPGTRTDSQLSEWLASPVSLVPSLGAVAGKAEYFEDATDDTSQAVEWTMPAGRFVDTAPILVLTTVSLRTGAGHHPRGTWDPRRFRANILIGLDGDGWIEDSWIGHPIRIGAVTMLPQQPCTRCTMVTRSQPGLDADVEIFRTLARHHSGLFGVWSDVAAPGRLSVGDRGTQPAPNALAGHRVCRDPLHRLTGDR
ncbi:MAG TPA: MOSC N-terminal beta barrel domain-containing protein [Oryzihumus sp.]|nr:MOSC N-terminal beta barrel domain-containing protein [Oryzihumus sp.]